MFVTRAHAKSLEERIVDLSSRLDRADKERQELLNRLLERNNITPIYQATPEPTETRQINIISPFSAISPELEEASRQAWIAEEVEYLMQTQKMDFDRARAQAERAFTEQHKEL